MTPDPRLLLPATRALLEGWCGPVRLDTEPAALVLMAEQPHAPLKYDIRSGNGDGCLHRISLDKGRISLDLSRAECRDRVARVNLGTVTEHRLARLASHHCNVFRRPGHIVAAASEACAKRFGGMHVPALADLDPNDPTPLPDGSRWVDARALTLVAESVLVKHG